MCPYIEALDGISQNLSWDQNPNFDIERWENEGGAIYESQIRIHLDTNKIKTVNELISKLNKADNEGDLDSILECYTESIVWYAPNGIVTKGIDEVRKRYGTLFGSFWLDFWILIDELKFDNKVGYCHGQTKGKMISKNTDEKVEINDNFVMTLLNDELGWRISTLMWVHNNNQSTEI